MIDVNKAFEGRWRIYGCDEESDLTFYTSSGKVKSLKDMCRAFFEAGYYLNDGIPMSAIVKAAEEVAFDEWWNLYDKKRGKEKCVAKWNKLSIAEKELCIAATPAYVASTPDKAYRKDPLTYLNGKCWNDEIINRNGTDKSTTDRDKLASILAP